MSEIPSSFGVFVYALIGIVVFTVVPLMRYLVKKLRSRVGKGVK